MARTVEAMQTTSPLPSPPTRIDRRNAVTLKLLFIAGLILALQIPLHLVNALRQERRTHYVPAVATSVVGEAVVGAADAGAGGAEPAEDARVERIFEGYRMVERAVKHGVLVMTLVFTAFFLFEMLAGLKLHPVHYGLVGAALCLFYLALLALGEVAAPGWAYVGAAASSSLPIVLYSAAILRGWLRAGSIAGLLTGVHGVLFVVLRMEDYALLAGTAALFVALAAVMYFTRNVDWHRQEAGSAAR